MSQHLHVLPGPGSLFDQDSLWIEGMNMVIEAQEAKRLLDQAQTQGKQGTPQVPRGPLGPPQFG